MPAHRLWMKSGASGRAINFNHTAIYDDEDHDVYLTDRLRLNCEPSSPMNAFSHILEWSFTFVFEA